MTYNQGMNRREQLNWSAGSPREKMQWAIEFAKADLNTLSESQWKCWEYSLENFVGGQISVTDEWTLDRAKACQQKVKELLGVWADHNARKGFKPGTKRSAFGGWTFSVKGLEQVRLKFIEPGKFQIAPQVVTDLQRAFVFCFSVAITGFDATTLRRCLKCQAVFVASHGRQLHCEKRCTWAKASKLYRGSHNQELKAKAYRRAEQKGHEAKTRGLRREAGNRNGNRRNARSEARREERERSAKSAGGNQR